ncbi:[Acyl-carrier-protein] S-malonyltransferase [Geodermatophilus pulveris]|uniref:[acyl-carrier-protein] S-malonyltransferase n=1 Tax=Geodermatophilus pulveris TaxID=1564159 RepID=A0A239FFL9_9ACTN|nr:acyltransferase domain-containing protein [Geodermatophilus pulveris]SNS54874.1 [Acyl-carrier-protein] S-malonyltransferase [Geodermatophilus pulveris]
MSGGPPAVAVVLAGEAGVRAGAVDAWLGDEAARQVVDEASAVVGRDVATWWRDPLALSCDTTAAHVEVVVSGVAGYRSLVARGLRPVVVAGHGVGEYAALVATGALPLDQAVELVHWRAELLSLSPRPSCAGMAAVVGPGAAEVARAVVVDVGATGTLAVASVDGPAQVVLAGGCDELARAREAVLAAGLDMVRLPGRTACHSPLVATTARHLAAALADLEWSEPDVPVVPNADGRPTRDPQQLAQCLRAHLTSTVQWEATSRALVEAGATAVVEVAAVPVLGPLVRQVHPDLPVHLAAGPGTPIPTEHATAVPVPTGGES